MIRRGWNRPSAYTEVIKKAVTSFQDTIFTVQNVMTVVNEETKLLENRLQDAREAASMSLKHFRKAKTRIRRLQRMNSEKRRTIRALRKKVRGDVAAVEHLRTEWMASPERGLDAIPALLESVLGEEG